MRQRPRERVSVIGRTLAARQERQSERAPVHSVVPAPTRSARPQIALTARDNELVSHPDRQAAFEALYDRYADRILRYCRYRIENLTDAEDLAAHILARAYGGFPPDQRSTFRAWLFTIAHHAVVDFYRRQGSRPQMRPLDASEDQLTDPVSTPEELVLQREDQQTLRRALTTLSEDQRQVVELRLAGLKGSEIAAVVGRSHDAVKMLQFRALRRLGKELTAPGSSFSSNPDYPFIREEQTDAF